MTCGRQGPVVSTSGTNPYIVRRSPVTAPPERHEYNEPHEPPQHRHHRPRRPRQDHARRQAAAAVRLVPRKPARRRARHGFERSREGARHHHPGQGDLGVVARHAHQHRRYARPRRFRRRGRAHPVDGRRRDRAGRCGRGADAADQVRGRQGAQARAAADRGHQQGRPAGRAGHRGGQRRVRPVRGARRHRRRSSTSRSSTAPASRAGWRVRRMAPTRA